jgi:CRP-like cAMP-binding protein
MEQRFSNNSLDLETLREFCRREGEAVIYRKGDQLEHEGAPARWLAFVTEGCFKYVTHGLSERQVGGRSTGIDKEHITWFSFEGEFVVDYPTFLYGRPSQTTIEAMMPSRVIRVSGEQMKQYFDQSKDTMELRAIIAEHLLFQFRSRYLELHCATPRERYNLLMKRCPGIVEHLDLQDIASFLNITPKTISKIRKEITFGKDCPQL